MKILNLTQHRATPEQIAQGVVDPTDEQRAEISRLLTFDDLPPSEDDLQDRAEAVAELALSIAAGIDAVNSVMIGGAPYFMVHLERECWTAGLRPLYAFAKRVSIEEQQADGIVVKRNVFRHGGFVGLEFAEVKR